MRAYDTNAAGRNSRGVFLLFRYIQRGKICYNDTYQLHKIMQVAACAIEYLSFYETNDRKRG